MRQNEAHGTTRVSYRPSPTTKTTPAAAVCASRPADVFLVVGLALLATGRRAGFRPAVGGGWPITPARPGASFRAHAIPHTGTGQFPRPTACVWPHPRGNRAVQPRTCTHAPGHNADPRARRSSICICDNCARTNVRQKHPPAAGRALAPFTGTAAGCCTTFRSCVNPWSIA